ncbi:MAG: M1 family aminopeptidase [Bacteroidota bacterium]
MALRLLAGLLVSLSSAVLAVAQTPLDAPLRTLPAPAVDIRHIEAEVDVRPSTPRFDVRLTVDRLTFEETDTLYVYLHDAEVQAIQFSVADDQAFEAVFAQRGDTLAIITPPSFVSTSPFRIALTYRAVQARDGELLMLPPSRYTASHWLPTTEQPWDPATLDLSLMAPVSHAALGTGYAGPDSLGAHRFVSTQPVGVSHIAVATGPLSVFADVAVAEGQPPTPLYLAQHGLTDDAVFADLGHLSTMLATLAERLGYAFPLPSYSAVLTPDVALTGAALSAMPTPPVSASSERAFQATQHLARQWMAEGVVIDGPFDGWMGDGFSTFLAAYLTADGDAEALALRMHALRDAYLTEAAQYQRPLVWDRWTTPAQLQDAHAEAKGAWAAYMLYQALGDAAFFRTLGDWLAASAGQRVETTSLQAAFRAAAAFAVDAFFDQWVYSAGHPVLEVTYRYDAAASELVLDVAQVQSGAFIPSAFAFPLTVYLSTVFGDATHTVEVTSARQMFTLPLDNAPRFVAVDPEGVVLAEVRVDQPAQAWVAQVQHAPSAVARVKAATALAQRPADPLYLLGLRAALEEATAPYVTRVLLQPLAAYPGNSLAERLLLSAMTAEDATVRRAALRIAQAHVGSTPLGNAALERAQAETDPQAQAEAVRTLAAIGQPFAYDVALAAFVTPSPADVVEVAGLDALRLLAATLPDDALDTYVRPRLRADATAVRHAALRAVLAGLAVRDDPAALLRWLRPLLGAEEPRIQQDAIAAFGQYGASGDVARLERYLADASPEAAAALQSAVRSIRQRADTR